MGLEVSLEEAEGIRGPELCGYTVLCPRGGELEGLCFKLIPRNGDVEEVLGLRSQVPHM